MLSLLSSERLIFVREKFRISSRTVEPGTIFSGVSGAHKYASVIRTFGDIHFDHKLLTVN